VSPSTPSKKIALATTLATTQEEIFTDPCVRKMSRWGTDSAALAIPGKRTSDIPVFWYSIAMAER
jgi:hypothetical protein